MADSLLSSFESLPLDSYRRSIATVVRALLAAAEIHPSHPQDGPPQREDALHRPSIPSTSSFFIHRYDPNILSEALWKQIPWRELCDDHDRRVQQQLQQDQRQCKKRKTAANDVTIDSSTMVPVKPISAASSTPLQTLLDLFQNDPSTFPVACTKSLAAVLLVQIVFMDDDDDDVWESDSDRAGHSQRPSLRDGDPAPLDWSCSTTSVDDPRGCGRGPSWEALLRSLLKCCERVRAVSVQELLLDQLGAQLERSEHLVNSLPAEAPNCMPRRITTVPQLYRIWWLITNCLELSSPIGSSSKLSKMARRHNSCSFAVLVKLHIRFLILSDDVEAQLKQQRSTARKEASRIDAEASQGSQLLDRRGLKRRNLLRLTSQQQVLLWHGEIDPSGAHDSEDDGATDHGSDSEKPEMHKLRRHHRQPSSDCGGSRSTRYVMGVRRPRGTDLTSMRSDILSKCLAYAESLTPAQGLQLLNSLLLPALDLKPWSWSMRLLIVLHTTATDRAAARQDLPITTAQPATPHRFALQHLLNEVWDRILAHLACHDNTNDRKFSYSSTCAYEASHGECPYGTGIALLQFYAEMLGELASFDDPKALVCAVQPLVKVITCMMDKCPSGTIDDQDRVAIPSFGSFDDDADPQSRDSAFAAAFRCALAFLLSRRGTQAVVDAVSHHGRGEVNPWTLLTLRYCQWSDWYHEAWYDDRVRIRLALRAAGILSVCNDSNVALATTPRSKLSADFRRGRRCGLRAFASTCSQKCKDLRELIHQQNQPVFSRGSKTAKDSNHARGLSVPTRQEEPSLSPDQHVSGDVIRHVLGYLGYKRLVRMRAVCREWRAMVDEPDIWRGLYVSRFGSPLAIPQSGSSAEKNLDWKAIFERKLAAERPLRFRRHDHGWKVRTCRFVGCLKVLTTPGMATRHEKTHVSSRTGGTKGRRQSLEASSGPSASSSSCTKRKRK